MDFLSHLSNLPYDIVENICGYLNLVDVQIMVDVAGLSKVQYFHDVISQKCSKVDIAFDIRLEKELFERIFEDRRRCLNIRELNLTFLYWIPATTIRKCMTRMKNLQTAYLVDTQVGVKKIDCRLYLKLKKLQTLRVLDKSHGALAEEFNFLHLQEKDFIVSRCKVRSNTRVDLYSVYPDKALDTCLLLFNKTWIEADNMDKHNKCIDVRADVAFREMLENENLIYKGVGEIRSFVRLEDLKELNILDMEIDVALPATFLPSILRYCKNLVSMKIAKRYRQFNIFCLEEAKALTDFRYTSKGNFQIDRFLKHLHENNLKLLRIFLQFESCVIFSKEPLLTFLSNNPQLVLFVIECHLPKRVRDVIRNTLNEYTRSPKCIFKLFETGEPKVPTIPIAHYDIVDITLNF